MAIRTVVLLALGAMVVAAGLAFGVGVGLHHVNAKAPVNCSAKYILPTTCHQ